jgi:hypothetical protein
MVKEGLMYSCCPGDSGLGDPGSVDSSMIDPAEPNNFFTNCHPFTYSFRLELKALKWFSDRSGLHDPFHQNAACQLVYAWTLTEKYTVKKAQWNFQLKNHVTFHLIGIKIVYNVKIIYISTY